MKVIGYNCIFQLLACQPCQGTTSTAPGLIPISPTWSTHHAGASRMTSKASMRRQQPTSAWSSSWTVAIPMPSMRARQPMTTWAGMSRQSQTTGKPWTWLSLALQPCRCRLVVMGAAFGRTSPA